MIKNQKNTDDEETEWGFISVILVVLALVVIGVSLYIRIF